MYLYRLGRVSFRRRWLVVSIWLMLLALVGVGASTLSKPTVNAFSIPGTESQQAIDLLGQRFPEAAAGGGTARVVFVAPSGQKLSDPANQAAVEKVIATLKTAPQVQRVVDPFEGRQVNLDASVGFAEVTYDVQSSEMTDQARAALMKAPDAGRAAGLTVEIGGDAVAGQPEQGVAEVIGVAVAAVVLVITFGSLIAAGLPLLTAIVGIAVSMLSITLLTSVVQLNASTSTLALMLGLAVAIDYALFIVSRYRHELSLGRDPQEAIGRAAGTAGSAVVFAGLTVVIALAGLAVVNIPFLTQMGLAAAGTVVVSVLIALTLLPALLGFIGPRVLGGRIPGLRSRDPEQDDGHTVGSRWGAFVSRHPVPVLLVAVLGLLTIAVPALDIRLGLPDDGMAASDTTQRKAYDLVSHGFGPGFNGPLTVVVDDASGKVTSVAAGVASTLTALPDVVAVSPPIVNSAGNTAILSVIPKSGPNDEATNTLVAAIRDKAQAMHEPTGATVSVTGLTAINIDISDRIAQSLLPYLALVVSLAILLLMLVFRSILVPIKAAFGFLLSVVAAFGAVVAVFQWGWFSGLLGVAATGPIVSLMPIFLIGIVFGLAMDYEVFLVTRMREEFVHGAEPSQAVVIGFRHGARVVTAAAIIMISVFAGFMFSQETLIKAMGFALAAAVALDAFVVRMTIVPAVMTLLGRSAWWLPDWLDRVLPSVDVEGEALRLVLDGPNRDRMAPEVTAPEVTAPEVTAADQSVSAPSQPSKESQSESESDLTGSRS